MESFASDKCLCGHSRWLHGLYVPDHCKDMTCSCPFFRLALYCPECGELVEDERTENGMKCAKCAYAEGEENGI